MWDKAVHWTVSNQCGSLQILVFSKEDKEVSMQNLAGLGNLKTELLEENFSLDPLSSHTQPLKSLKKIQPFIDGHEGPIGDPMCYGL